MDIPDGFPELALLGMDGRVLWTRAAAAGPLRLERADLPAGMALLELRGADGKTRLRVALGLDSKSWKNTLAVHSGAFKALTRFSSFNRRNTSSAEIVEATVTTSVAKA